MIWLLVVVLAGGVACEWPFGAPSRTPASREELPTTDGEIAIGNLEAQIEAWGAPAFSTVAQRSRLAGLLALRGRFLGRIEDHVAALSIADGLVQRSSGRGDAYLVRARARGLLHQFSGALDDLDRASRFGAPTRDVETLRAGIFQALGRYDEALRIRRRHSKRFPGILTLGAEAALKGELGAPDQATRLFGEAESRYRDVSPFPLAWLYFEEGRMWMREERHERARVFFQAALKRLPAYAAARGHLGEAARILGDKRRAVELLRPLAESSSDPDHAAQLALTLEELGRGDEADLWRRRARHRYEKLLDLHPEAFLDHAAEFWLSVDPMPERAFRLARRNLEIRKTPRAYELALHAAVNARNRSFACRKARELDGTFEELPRSVFVWKSKGLDACSSEETWRRTVQNANLP